MRVAAMTLAALTLSAAAQAQIPDFTPQTPLIGALLHNDSAEAKRLLDAGADPAGGRFIGFPPVLLAVLRQDRELLRAMVARGADLDARDRSGSTALMWAAFDEHGDAAMVEELLRLGADPRAANQAGETALDWALRRGETPAVEALRRAGASDGPAIAESAAKAIALLQRSGAEFTRVSGCFSCHHQSLPQMALGIARAHGLQLDEAAARLQVEATVSVLKRVHEEAIRNRDRIPDVPISVSYALLGLSAAHYKADLITDAMVQAIESNAFAATALSLRALQLYGTRQDERIARAADWLRTAAPRTTEERAMQLLGLAWAKAPADQLRRSADALLAEQRQDGGWAQLPTLETDAYATGQALAALQTAGHDTASPAYRRGVSFLLRTQFPDGSWLVRSRTFQVQPPRDSGFPHGKHQWISAAGTSWAAMALALAVPPPTDVSTPPADDSPRPPASRR